MVRPAPALSLGISTVSAFYLESFARAKLDLAVERLVSSVPSSHEHNIFLINNRVLTLPHAYSFFLPYWARLSLDCGRDRVCQPGSNFFAFSFFFDKYQNFSRDLLISFFAVFLCSRLRQGRNGDRKIVLDPWIIFIKGFIVTVYCSDLYFILTRNFVCRRKGAVALTLEWAIFFYFIFL